MNQTNLEIFNNITTILQASSSSSSSSDTSNLGVLLQDPDTLAAIREGVLIAWIFAAVIGAAIIVFGLYKYVRARRDAKGDANKKKDANKTLLWTFLLGLGLAALPLILILGIQIVQWIWNLAVPTQEGQSPSFPLTGFASEVLGNLSFS